MDTEEFKKTIGKIVENYEGIERSLVHQLRLQVPQHGPTTGSYRENVWRSLFRMIIPKKYQIEQGVFIIDSKGNISKEVDLAVFDEMYTPYLFNYGEIKFIPIEAVSVVIQCKSKISHSGEQVIDKNGDIKNDIFENIKNWVASINKLKTSLDSVARMAAYIVDNNEDAKTPLTQTATRPIKILCATDITGGIREELSKRFDILLYIADDKLKKEISDEETNYLEWNRKLNHAGEKNDTEDKGNHSSLKTRNLKQLRVPNVEVDAPEKTILSLTFQLNQLLMLINNPMLFPHRAYAGMFSEVLTETKKEGKGRTDERK